jgi:hypothetical protein
MKRREDAQGIRGERTNPHAIGRAASESERPPATAPMSNDHGTRICRVVPRRVERRIAWRDKSASRPSLFLIRQDQQG